MTDTPLVPVLDNLSDREQELVEAARRGRVLACSGLAIDDLAADEDPDCQVRADLIRELLLGRHGQLDPRGILLHGARIIGVLNLDHATASVGLRLMHCVVAEPITACNGHFPWLDLSRSLIHTLFADGLRVDRDLVLAEVRTVGSSAFGTVRMLRARVGGVLLLDGAELTNATGPALTADGLQINDDMRLVGARATSSSENGTIRLLGAHIGGQLDLGDAEITNDVGPALAADGLQVKNGARLVGARASASTELGAVRLQTARIGGQLDLGDAEITNDVGPALAADGLHIDSSVRLTNVRATGAGDLGTIRLHSAHIGGQLDLDNAQITNASGVAMDFEDAAVEGTVFLPIDVVCPAPALRPLCPHPTQVRIGGFTYGDITRTSLNEWLHVIRCHTEGYSPGPYQQLAAVERAAGHDSSARRILITQQQDHYQRHPRSLGGWWTRRFHWMWGALAGYGYRVRRTAGALLLALAVAGALGFWAGHVTTPDGHRAAERTESFTNRTGESCSTVELIGVGLDRGLPLSPTGVRARCDLNTGTNWGQVFTIAIWVVQAAVWGLATLALAGYTGLVRKTT